MNKSGHTNVRFRSLWNSRRGASLLALLLLATWLLFPVAAAAQEPTPRATPTPVKLLEITPPSGMPGIVVTMRGYGFMGAAQVNATWDGESLLENVSVRLDGSFETQFEIPSATAGEHVVRVLVAGDPTPWAEIVFEVFLPTATPTSTFTPTLTPTHTPRPTDTRAPTSTPRPTDTPYPTSTSLPTSSPTAKPTLRMATPIRVVPTAAPATPTYVYRWPTSTFTPIPATPLYPATATTTVVAGSETPVTTTVTTTPLTQTVEATVTSAPSGTISVTAVQSATATSTSTVSMAAAASTTPTATITPLPTDDELANTGIGPFAMVLAGGVLLGAGALGLRHLRANVLA